ncbi:MAG: LexA family transcriptional regulator, partial [Phycisphaerae bacterium]
MNLTLDQLAAATGISKPYLSNIENARMVGPPSEDILSRIEKTLAINTGELVGCAEWLRTPKTIRQLFTNMGTTGLPRHNSGAVDLDRLLRQNENHASAIDETSVAEENGVVPAEHIFPNLVKVPLINRVAAGSPAEFTDLDYPAGIADAYIPAPRPSSAEDEPGRGADLASGMFALRVVGDSMSPQYLPGDIIVLSTLETPADGDD